MQTPNADSHAWLWNIAYVLSGIASSSVAWYLAIRSKGKVPSEIEESKANTELARTQTQKATVDMLGSIMKDLNDSIENQNQMRREISSMRTTISRYVARDAEFAILEAQVARARAQGFLDRDEKRGSGPNPAA